MAPRTRAPGPADQRRPLPPMGSGVRREMVRNRLIESRLTPNAISLTGLVLNVVAAVLVWQELYVWGGIAFVVGSVCDTLENVTWPAPANEKPHAPRTRAAVDVAARISDAWRNLR